MTHSVVGVQDLLQHDWHTNLTPTQFAAYIRYHFVYLNENVIDWDSPAHKYHRRAWREGDQKTRDGSRRSSTWHEVARKIAATSAATGQLVYPGIWVHAHFSPAAGKRLNKCSGLSEIKPAVLYADSAPHIYSQYVQHAPALISHNFTLAAATAQLRLQSVEAITQLPTFRQAPLGREDKLAYALCDETYVTAPPFFRYALAVKFGCPSAAAMYLWPAAIHYEANQPLYDAAEVAAADQWYISKELTDTVAEIRAHWSNYCE